MDEELSGEALRVAVAERVMGWHWREHGEGAGRRRLLWSPDERVVAFVQYADEKRPTQTGHLPDYESDIAAAFEVIEAMRARGYLWFGVECIGGSDWPWRAMFSDGNRHFAWGDSPAEAICRAALQAVADKPEQSPPNP